MCIYALNQFETVKEAFIYDNECVLQFKIYKYLGQ